MKRMDRTEYFMAMADLAAKRSPCERRQIGAVAVINDRIVATGFNGPPAGMEHCTKETCVRMLNNIPSGTQLEFCRSVHAEANLLVQCASSGANMAEAIVYCTHTPCTSCMKLLLGTNIKRLICKEWYPDKYTLELLELSGMLRLRRTDDDFIEYTNLPLGMQKYGDIFTGICIDYSNGDKWIYSSFGAVLTAGNEIKFSNDPDNKARIETIDIYDQGKVTKRFIVDHDNQRQVEDCIERILGKDEYAAATFITKGYTRECGGTYESISEAAARATDDLNNRNHQDAKSCPNFLRSLRGVSL